MLENTWYTQPKRNSAEFEPAQIQAALDEAELFREFHRSDTQDTARFVFSGATAGCQNESIVY